MFRSQNKENSSQLHPVSRILLHGVIANITIFIQFCCWFLDYCSDEILNEMYEVKHNCYFIEVQEHSVMYFSRYSSKRLKWRIFGPYWQYRVIIVVMHLLIYLNIL